MDSGHYFAQHGPLGFGNMRQCLGRSAILGTADLPTVPAAPEGTEAGLVFASAMAPKEVFGRPAGDSLAACCACTTSVEYLNQAARDAPPRVIGTLQWGTDGTQGAVQFDWLHGTVVQAVASGFKVSARLLEPYAGAGIAEGVRVRVGAWIGYYPASHCGPRITTSRAIAADTEAIDVPPYACRAQVRASDGTVGELAWLAAPGGQVLSLESVTESDVPGGARVLSVAGLTVGQILTVLWDLSL